MLTDFVRTDEAGAPALLQEVKAYLDEGRQPTDSRVGDYLETLAIDRMLGNLSPVENALLSLSKGIDLPVPITPSDDPTHTRRTRRTRPQYAFVTDRRSCPNSTAI